jgi:hypothetical protein
LKLGYGMAFGWSAGDIASALKLLLVVGKAVKEACSASSEYEDTHKFLTTLQATLQHLQAFDTAIIRFERIEELREQCRLLRLPLRSFLTDVEKFEPFLVAGSKKRILSITPRRLQWALVMPGKVKQLRDQILAPMLSIGVIMGLYTM